VAAGKRHHVAVLAVLIGVARRRGDGLAGRLIGVDAFPFEGDLGGVVADEDVLAGEHEDRDRLEPVLFGGGDVGGDDRVRPGLAAKYGRDIPSDDELLAGLKAEQRVLLAITPDGPPSSWAARGFS